MRAEGKEKGKEVKLQSAGAEASLQPRIDAAKKGITTTNR